MIIISCRIVKKKKNLTVYQKSQEIQIYISFIIAHFIFFIFQNQPHSILSLFPISKNGRGI